MRPRLTEISRSTSSQFTRGIALTWAALALEWLVVVLGSPQIANLWEIQFGSLWLAPAAVLVSAALAVPWIAYWQSLLNERLWRRRAALFVFALLGAGLGYGLSEGRHFAEPARRFGFVCVMALAAFAGSVMLGRWLSARLIQGRLLELGLAASGFALSCELANRWLLVRLYPAFHLGLSLFSVGAVTLLALVIPVRAETALNAAENTENPPLAAHPWRRGAQRAGGQLARNWVLGVIGLGLLLLSWSSRRLAHFDNFRWTLMDQAPLLGRAVELAGWVTASEADPDAAGRDGANGVLGAAVPSSELQAAGAGITSPKGLELENADVLLITIDALRADHVGSYGYARDTTPHLDALTHTGVRFEHAYCATPHTSYSVTSLMTGKYIRPLLRQGLGQQSETWASQLRRYGYRTGAFYPPAVFFIDAGLFQSFEQSSLGFEYEKKEFLEGAARVAQVETYLEQQPSEKRVFTWVHLFGPHEPYEPHAEYSFGEKDVDRYDGEVRAADETVGQLVQAFRKRRPNSLVVVTADHGEEFGEHGGRYHGSSVYEEQVRVPLVFNLPNAPTQPRVIPEPVQSVDLMPTVLSLLKIPVGPRVRGLDLSPRLAAALSDSAPKDEPLAGFAYSETEEQTLLAQGNFRLVCLRRFGACKLYDLTRDPAQQTDRSKAEPSVFERMRTDLRQLNAKHGTFEGQGEQAPGAAAHWPPALVRAIAGDGDAAPEVAELLDDADVTIRRRAAQTLLQLRRIEAAPALSLAAQRDEDLAVRRYSAIALTRLGETAPLTLELLRSSEPEFRRLAALALAETGDSRGSDILVAWWLDSEHRDFTTSRDLLLAFAKLRCKDAVIPLTRSLSDVRLRPEIAATLGKIGEEGARSALLARLLVEPYQNARSALAEAIVQLKGDTELVVPLRHWLGVPDPLKGGVGLALRAGILEHLGGPGDTELRRLRQNSDIGELVRLTIPKTGNGKGLRWLVRARNRGTAPQALRLGVPLQALVLDKEGRLKPNRRVPELDPARQLVVELAPTEQEVEVQAEIPDSFGWKPGHAVNAVVYAPQHVSISAFVVLPLQEELGTSAGEPGKVTGSVESLER